MLNVYFLQVVDMRWGVRDEATDDHMTTTLCMQEIDNCQRLSIGPNFVVSRNEALAGKSILLEYLRDSYFSAAAVYNQIYSKLSTNQKQSYICKSAIYAH